MACERAGGGVRLRRVGRGRTRTIILAERQRDDSACIRRRQAFALTSVHNSADGCH